MMKYGRVLAVGAHTDDIELGCGGLLSRLQREGAVIHVMAFSIASESLPDHLEPDTLATEFQVAMTHLDLPPDAVTTHRFPVRRLAEHRQEILEVLVKENRDYRPDLVLTMNSHDTHQDHEVIHAESVRAFRSTSLLGYETPWNQRTADFDLFVEISEADVERKLAMLGEYRSQQELGRAYAEPDYVRAATRFRGYQGRLPLAEVYEVLTMRWSLDE